MANGTCSIDGCERPHYGHGWCKLHYDRWRSHGDPLIVTQVRTPAARFWAKVRVADVADPDACWLWTAPPERSGYGQLKIDERMVKAHRFAYELLVGPIPPGLEVDHLCHGRDKSCKGGPSCIHRRCVNPEHLEAVPHRTNVLRGDGHTAKNAAKTACPAGHEFTLENTYLYRGWRHCRTCQRARTVAYRARRRQQETA